MSTTASSYPHSKMTKISLFLFSSGIRFGAASRGLLAVPVVALVKGRRIKATTMTSSTRPTTSSTPQRPTTWLRNNNNTNSCNLNKPCPRRTGHHREVRRHPLERARRRPSTRTKWVSTTPPPRPWTPHSIPVLFLTHPATFTWRDSRHKLTP